MKPSIVCWSLILLSWSCSQPHKIDLDASYAFQKKLNSEYLDPESSPLEEEALKVFESLDFFPIDKRYIVNAKFVRTPDEEPFEMPTTTERRPLYVKYGEAHFSLNNIQHQLNIYQSIELSKTEEYKDYIFIPFTDKTSGETTYGGGRYLDLNIPDGETILIDFNQAYNPYCAYNHKYSCPIPPTENYLNTEVKAGVKAFNK